MGKIVDFWSKSLTFGKNRTLLVEIVDFWWKSLTFDQKHEKSAMKSQPGRLKLALPARDATAEGPRGYRVIVSERVRERVLRSQNLQRLRSSFLRGRRASHSGSTTSGSQVWGLPVSALTTEKTPPHSPSQIAGPPEVPRESVIVLA